LGQIPFSPEEEETIRKMALFMRISGGLMIAGAALSIIGGIIKAVAVGGGPPQLAGNLCGGLIGAGIVGGLAFLLMQGAKAFQLVADTDGSDQDHLATGFEKLKFYFMAKGILTIVLFLLICCLCGLMLMGGAAMMQRFQ